MHPVKISGDLVALRELTEDDEEPLHRVYGDEQVTEYLSFTPRTLGQCRAIITAAIADAAADPRTVYMLAVADPATGELIGAARLGLGEWQSGQIGFALRADQWKHGRGTAAVRLLQQLAFDHLGLHRLWGARDRANTASALTLGRAGMVVEGVIRGHVQRHGVWKDSVSHSILENEYAQTRLRAD
jgi:[ribosomal protein S5]-alanine N-acetyltransferase